LAVGLDGDIDRFLRGTSGFGHANGAVRDRSCIALTVR
jgi:hypothetical protein